MRVLRIYHAGRDRAHRRRDAALVDAGNDIHLVVPNVWPDAGSERRLSTDAFPIHEVVVRRGGSVNAHWYERGPLAAVIDSVRPDLIDVHAEPVSAVLRQVLRLVGSRLPVTCYTAQNLDKRYPPPFAQWERRALQRVSGIYACSAQAASVARGKGFSGALSVIPLGLDTSLFAPGRQDMSADELVLGLVGRLEAHKGVADAVTTARLVAAERPCRLLLVGAGDMLESALSAADECPGLTIEHQPWADHEQLVAQYQRMHVLLMPSHVTSSWVEQFGRVAVEAQACGAIVAGYATGAIPEVAGELATLVSDGDVGALADAVLVAAQDKDQTATRRLVGIRRAAQFDWSVIARDQTDLYADAVSKSHPLAPTGRQAAIAEFGPPAHTRSRRRPVAVPGMRIGRRH